MFKFREKQQLLITEAHKNAKTNCINL